MDVWSKIIGQSEAVETLKSSSKNPVHAYLFLGPPGSGKHLAAKAFAASIFCSKGGCGLCLECQKIERQSHPDFIIQKRDGAFISVDQARHISRLAFRSPMQSSKQILVLEDFHLVDKAAPALLKTIEEPPSSTIFIILAEVLNPELATVASRCMRINFSVISEKDIIEYLIEQNIEKQVAEKAAKYAGGNLEKAKLFALNPDLIFQDEKWIFLLHNPTSSNIVEHSHSILEVVDQASKVLGLQQAKELDFLSRQAKELGDKRLVETKQIQDRHKREQKKLRRDIIYLLLSQLIEMYRLRLEKFLLSLASDKQDVSSSQLVHDCREAITIIESTASRMIRNPNEQLQLQAMIISLSRLNVFI